MKITIQGDEKRLAIAFRPTPKLSAFGSLTGPLISVLLLLFFAATDRIPFWIPLVGLGLALLCSYSQLWQVRAGTTVVIDSEGVTINRQGLGSRDERRFARADVEYIGYQPEINAYQTHEESALGLMARTVLFPAQFAHTISPEEATEVFEMMKTSDIWLSERIRPVGTPII